MKKILFCTAALCGLLSAQGNKPAYEPGQIIVRERSGANQAAVASALNGAGKLIKNINQTKHHVLGVPEGQVDKVINSLVKTGLFSFAERDGRAYPTTTPNDPNFGSQWHLKAVNAPTAWSSTVGSSMPIAVIDSGVDATHPDLKSRVGPGWNFLTGTAITSDTMGHGSATAGTVAAASNNGTGVAGVTWSNPIMPLVVVDSTGYASYSNIASAIVYAADNGARIVNISIAGTAPSSTLQNAVDYAWGKGTVVFAAAGNSSSSSPMYPAACNNVVSVSATDSSNSLASFSEYGSWIDLAAPGVSILTTMQGGGYGYWNGTSFAAPIAAGVGALVLAVQPSLSASGLVSLLESNADYIGASTYFGFGLVDAGKAVAAALGSVPATPSVTISSPGYGSTVSGTVNVNGSASDSMGINSVTVYCDGSPVTSSNGGSFSIPWNTTSVTNGTHTITATAIDMGGNAGSSSVTVNVSQPAAPVQDTIAPSVQITSPTIGYRVSGNNTTINVSASDNVGVTQVSIYVDGVQVYTATAAPYRYGWNTKKLSQGSHTISATAWDAAGNNSSTSVGVYK